MGEGALLSSFNKAVGPIKKKKKGGGDEEEDTNKKKKKILWKSGR